MGADFVTDRPLYMQLQEEIVLQIITGMLRPGDRLPSTRELALEYRVNPNTVQRALMELDRLGLTQTERTSGRFVRAHQAEIKRQKRLYIQTLLRECDEKLQRLGTSMQEVCSKMGWTERREDEGNTDSLIE